MRVVQKLHHWLKQYGFADFRVNCSIHALTQVVVVERHVKQSTELIGHASIWHQATQAKHV